MNHSDPAVPAGRRRKAADPDELCAELEDLCRLHDVSVELIRRSDDVEDLVQGVLDEFERRLESLPRESLGNTPAQDVEALDDPGLRTLRRFAGQAVALKTRAENTAMLRSHAEALEQANGRLREAAREADETARQLDTVLDAMDSAIVILGPDGTVRRANRAAAALTGEGNLEGLDGKRLTGDVAPMSDGEIRWDGGDARAGSARVLLVSRRAVSNDSGDEVLLLHDVTERDRRVAERHQSDKMAELLRAVGVLAHKINNPLTALLGRAQILRMAGTGDERTAKAARVIEDSGKRIAALIHELAVVVKTGDVEHLERVLHMEESGGHPRGGAR